MNFMNDIDKQIVRMGGYILFLEQLVQQQKQETEQLKVQLDGMARSKSAGETAGTGEPEVPKSE